MTTSTTGLADEPGTLGTLLRWYRGAAALTQEQLAERAGLSLRTIKYLEQDRGRKPRQATLLLLAGALDLSAKERGIFLAAARGEDQAVSPLKPRWAPRAEARRPLYPLIGRQDVLRELEMHLQRGEAPLHVLAGEPGIGKTRLLREVAQNAVAAGWTVLTGGSYRPDQDPYAPLLAALQHHLAGQDTLTLQRTLESCAWLVRLLPELAESPLSPPSHPSRNAVSSSRPYIAI